MQNDDRLTPMERELEAALGGLKPSSAAMDRDRVMFHAGQVSIRRRGRLWQGACVCLVVALLASIATRPKPSAMRRNLNLAADADHQVHLAASVQSHDALDKEQIQAFRDYIRMRQAVLDRGVQALPASRTLRPEGSEPPLTREHLAEILLSST